MEFLPIERCLMDALLAGDDPTLESLRAQYAGSTVAKREGTGSGFFLDLSVPEGVSPSAPPALRIGDVVFEFAGFPDGGEAILWVHDGRLSNLEAFARGGVWPEGAQLESVGYFSGPERDLDWLRQSWGD